MKGINIIAALGRDRGIGYQGQLLWRIPEDLKRFKALTTGYPIIMGRKTFESIGRPLPKRTNIVVTSRNDLESSGILPVRSVEEAVTAAWAAGDPDRVFVIGGEAIYRAMLPFAERLYLTLIDAQKPADTYFPAYEGLFPNIRFDETHEWEGITYRFIELER